MSLYLVFDNKTLRELVEKKPRTKEELAQITGIGPKKIEIWGEYLIHKINGYLGKK